MYTIDFTAVIAIALVALVLISIRISWTLKEMCDALSSNGAAASRDAQAANALRGQNAAHAEPTALANAESAAAGPDETELAAVIAIAHEAFRAAV